MMDEKKEARINESGLKQDFEIIITPGDVKQDVTSKVDLKEAFYNLGPSTDFASVFDLERKDFLDVLKIFSPGTAIRTALDDILRARMGALIVVDQEGLSSIIEGGFKVNCRFTPNRLFELCKMDGAIVVSSDLKKILYANVLLTPNPNIPTSETGTRHKSGERTAIQANTFVIVAR